MAWNVTNLSPGSRITGKNVKGYSNGSKSGSQNFSAVGREYTTEESGKSGALQTLVQSSDYTSAISGVSTGNKLSLTGCYDYTNGTLSTETSGTTNLGNSFSYQDISNSPTGVGYYRLQPDEGKEYSSYTYRVTATGWTCSFKGSRTSYNQSFKYTIDNASAFADGQIRFKVTNTNTKYARTCYVALSKTAGFLNDYTSALCYTTFDIPANVQSATWTSSISLKSFASAIQKLGTTTMYFIVGFSPSTAWAFTTVSDAQLDYSLNYKKVPAPTNVTIDKTLIKPSDSVTISWSKSTLTGYANTVSGYEIKYSSTKDGVAATSGTKKPSNNSASVTSYTFAGPGDDVSRGRVYAYYVRALSSVAGYESDWAQAGKTCTINSRPTLTLNSSSVKIKSSDTSFTISGSVLDSDASQTIKYGYSTEEDTDPSTSYATTNKKFTASIAVSTSTLSQGDSKSYYVKAWDGLEWSEAAQVFTVERNVKPAYSSTSFDLSGTARESTKLSDTRNKSYFPIVTADATKAQTKTGGTRYYIIRKTNTLDDDNFSEVGTPIKGNSSGVMKSRYIAFTYPPGDTGYKYQVGAYYSDGLETSDTIWSNVAYVAPAPKPIDNVIIYNDHGCVDVSGAYVVNGVKDFYQNFSFELDGYDTFYTEKAELLGSVVIGNVVKSDTIPLTLVKTGDDKFYANGVYKGTEYGNQHVFSMRAHYSTSNGDNNYDVTKDIGVLRRTDNPIIDNFKSWQETQQGAFHPYVKSSISIILPYESNGAAGNACMASYSIPDLSTVLTCNLIIDSTNYTLAYVSNLGGNSLSLTTEWEWGNNGLNRRADIALRDVPLQIGLKNVFGEDFSVKLNSATFDFREPLKITNISNPKISCRYTGEGEGANRWVEYIPSASNPHTFFEGERIKFSCTISGYSQLRTTLQLTASDNVGARKAKTFTLDQTEETSNGSIKYSASVEISFIFGEQQTDNANVSFSFAAKTSVEGIETETPVIIAGYTVGRFVNPVFQFDTAKYGKLSNGNKGYVFSGARIDDYGGGGEKTIDNLKNAESNYPPLCRLQYLSNDGEYVDVKNGSYPAEKIIDFNSAQKEIIEIEGGFPYSVSSSGEKTEWQTATFQIGMSVAIIYQSIGDYTPYNYDTGETYFQKTTWKSGFLIYNISPTVRYGRNRIGINVIDFSVPVNNEANIVNFIELSAHDKKDTVAAIGTSVNLDNFIISGGTWD